jgi:hypothetical protein
MRIQGSDGNPLCNTTVSSTTQPGTLRLVGTTNATGYIIFADVPVGNYSFSVVKDGYVELDKAINFKGSPIKMTLALSTESEVSAASDGGNSLLVPIVIVVVVVVVLMLIIGFVVAKRRHRARMRQKYRPSNFKLSTTPT